MADRFYGYQYDTSPRKLNTDYNPYAKRYPKQEEPVITSDRNRSTKAKRNENVGTRNTRVNKANKSTRANTQTQEKMVPENRKKQVTKVDIKKRLKIVMFLIAGFSVLFAISYQNSLISESFNRKEQYKKEMEALSKTNQQLEVSIENNLNLNNIEQAAKDRLGMQKLSNNQKIYVSLPKEDYIAPAAEQIVIEDDLNFFQKLIKGFTKSVN